MRRLRMIGALLFETSTIVGGLAVNSLAELVICRILYGIGRSIRYILSSSLQMQSCSSHLGTANGVYRLGIANGAIVMATVVQLPMERAGSHDIIHHGIH